MIDIEAIKNNITILYKKIDCLNIDSIFVEYDGKIDKFFYNEEKLHELRSCSKLLVAMAIGIAIDKKMLTLDTKVYPILKTLVDIKNEKNIEKIKKWDIRSLLTHTTGYKKMIMTAKEIKEKNLDINNILNYVLNVDIPYQVGTKFVYNNVEPFILSVFFQEKFKIKLSDFINENIFKKLDIKKYQWNDYGKYCPGCTGLFLNHSDFHKIGKLLLNDGVYKDTQVISKNWINMMCLLQFEISSVYKTKVALPMLGAGYYTFISKEGYVFRNGSNGQYIILNRDNNLLITIMSSEKNRENVMESLRILFS
ncbi:serine hydrolase [Thomasclavelia sp.]|uniref:serine hydrolase domain-containing protein n=1 Tax=Thomasclavelia sp. TaxID=3025757 RepID=UPI0026163A00|nr:serine hydrolase [Thomasclavelia sp.]